MTARTEILLKLGELLRAQGYQVHRGAVNWANHPWDRIPRMASIVVLDCTIGGNPTESMTLAIQLFQAMNLKEVPKTPGLQDAVLENQYSCLAYTKQQLYQARSALPGAERDSMVGRIGPISVTEHSNVEYTAQGITGTFEVEF